MNGKRWLPAAWAAGGLLFVLLATANAGGYRYGASDQAFYIPVVMRALNPAAFPRDAGLIDAQGRLMVLDEAGAALVRGTGLSLEVIFVAGYLVCLALAWLAILLIGSRLFRHPWATVALGAAFTLRHRIPRTSANSFEPYFYPRMLAFAIGLLAIAAVLHRRLWLAVALVAVAGIVHVTVGVGFAVLIGTAIVVLEPRLRRMAAAAALAAAALAAWAFLAGPLSSPGARMDPQWLAAVGSKDSLFATEWPAWAWILNLALPAVLWWVHRQRASRGDATAADGALVWGALVLVAVFLVTLPAVAARWALPTQLQISRVFWLVDFVVVLYVTAMVADRASDRVLNWPRMAACGLLALSVARGGYVMLVEFPERPLFEVHLRETPWRDAMAWVGRRPIDAHVLADPAHAWKYGTSVRVAAGRDVFLEETKDSALAIYSRDVALRVIERTRQIGDFSALSPSRAQELARTYGLDYLVTEADMTLPLAYSNGQFRIYSLGADISGPSAGDARRIEARHR